MKAMAGRRYRHQWISMLIFVGPIFCIYTFCFTFSLVGGIYYSFTNWSGVTGTEVWIGFKNYVRIFAQDQAFMESMKRTAIFVFWNCLFTNVIAMVFAVLLEDSTKLNNGSRMMIFMPNVISLIVTGFIWQFLLSRVMPQMYASTGWSIFGMNLLGDPKLVIYGCVLVSLWSGIGYIMVIYISALQGIDGTLIDAGRVDGCSSWKIFWKIKMPEMMSTVSVGIFLNIAGSIKIFDLIWSLTKGGPGNASEVVMINVYREAFERRNAGYANAKAVVLTGIIIAITLLQLKLTKQKEA